MIKCLTSSRFSMECEILTWVGLDGPGDNDLDYEPWTTYQDPITKEIRNSWVPGDELPVPSPAKITVPCLARGIVDGGIRVAGSSETFGTIYHNSEYVRLWFPAWVDLTKSDRVTNIVDANGRAVWLDEERIDGTNPPTIFNVNGVQPLFDAFNNQIENFALLQKVDRNEG